MSDDLIKRLREADSYNKRYYGVDPLHKEAAKRIEQLERERDEEGINHLAWKLEAEATQANLAKAVDVLRELGKDPVLGESYIGWINRMMKRTRAMLAELEGKDE